MSNTPLPPSSLRSGQLRVVNASEGLTLRVLQGRLWVTVPNDRCDHFIAQGAELRLNTPGVVLEADSPAGPGPVCEVRYTLAPAHPRRRPQKSGPRAAFLGWGSKPLTPALGG